MSSTKIQSSARRRGALAAVPLAALTLGLAACAGEGSTPAAGTSADTPKVAAVIKGLDNPFFQAMQDGVQSTAQSAGVDVTVQAAADIGDTTGQADKLTALAGQDFSCFVVNPISGTNLVQSLAQISAADKTIVNIDQPVDATAAEAANLKIATYIGTDNETAGGKAGEFVASTAGAGAEVAIVGGIPGDVTSAARVEGFKAATEGH